MRFGQNPPGSLTMPIGEFREQKYRAKRAPELFVGYDWKKDLPKAKDSFRKSLTPEETVKFAKRLDEFWLKNANQYGRYMKLWYMIMEGPKTGLYQNPWRFRKIRDEFYKENETYSWKGCWFHSYEDAVNFIQWCRDEEGQHFSWPVNFPVYWYKGSIELPEGGPGTGDLTEFPGYCPIKQTSQKVGLKPR